MRLVKNFKFIAAAALTTGLLAGSTAIAGTIPFGPDGAANPHQTGTYQGVYDMLSVKSGDFHSTYLPNIGLPNKHLQFDPASHAKFDWLSNAGPAGSGFATLKGDVTQNGDSNVRFALDFKFNFDGKDASRTPKCEIGCNGSGFKPGYNADNSSTPTVPLQTSDYFEYFSVDASSRILGVAGTATEGLVFGIVQAPDPTKFPMQLGFGANNKTKGIDGNYPDPLAVFGLSVWFFLDILENPDGALGLATVNQGDTAVRLSGHGDINVELDYPFPVPVPAALPLFGSGLALLGLLGWRRKRQDAESMAA